MVQRWTIDTTDEYDRRLNKWPKKYNRELNSVLLNLDRVHKSLNAGAKVEEIKFGFIHREPSGVIAIDQKGGGSGLKQTRLYCYPSKNRLVIILLTLGDKDTQKKRDIPFCKEFIEQQLKEDEELLKDETATGAADD